MIHYSFVDTIFYLYLYSFLSWCIEVSIYAIKDRKFVNRGLLNLPLLFPYGITAVILIFALPTLNHNYIMQYLFTFFTFYSVWSLSSYFVKKVSHEKVKLKFPQNNIEQAKRYIFTMSVSVILLLFFLIIHPVFYGFFNIVPNFIINLIVISLSILLIIDFISVQYTLITNTHIKNEIDLNDKTNQFGQKIVDLIWSRLQKAYPGIESDQKSYKNYTFADGIGFDKIIWIFLISSFLGAIIEMIFCRLNGYPWMSRSSLLYGPFSVVWGLGAVLLTIVLQPLMGKEDRYTFVAGFFIGGVYEYLCSVFTEIVFGTIFWDYSGIPFNIGGRINALFCVFWGVLAVLWVKILYPLLDHVIEKIPPITGKIFTWFVLVFMVCNVFLTSCALYRFTERQTNPTPQHFYDEFLDSTYDDEWMEHRWPNMKITNK